MSHWTKTGLFQRFTNWRRCARMLPKNRCNLHEGEPVLFDLDRIDLWVQAPDMPIDCPNTLNEWNLFIDVARSVSGGERVLMSLDSQPAIYDEVFWGNSLPPITPAGCEYVPAWTCE